ncbi:MAG: hypothetical protein PF795_05445 [Kiritimatiellae bacterium]|nr:hypothetical protein [Kiritimatiellia bacterium]
MFFALSLPAQQLKLNKGDFEVATSAMFNRAELSGNVRFGAFVMDYVQLGLDVGYQDTDFFSRSSLAAYVMALVETRTYFLPYYGGGLYYSSLDPNAGETFSGLDFRVFGGVKYYMADNVSLNTELTIGYSTDDTYIKDSETNSSDIGIQVGISYLW